MDTDTSGIPLFNNQGQFSDKESDLHLKLLYNYHQRLGYKHMLVTGIVNAISSLFGILFSMFIVSCVNWTSIFDHTSKSLHDAMYDTCWPKSNWVSFAYTLYLIGWLLHVGMTVSYLSQATEVHELWTRRLELPEDVKWISWKRVTEMYAQNIDPQATDDYIVSKVLRFDNYLIAMLNRNIFGFDGGRLFTKTIEWSLWLSFRLAFFTPSSGLPPDFLHQVNHHTYTRRLKLAFMTVGGVSALFAPFIFLASLVYFAYHYGSMFHKDPHKVGLLQFTPLAKWKLRDFNELPHVFNERLEGAHEAVKEFIADYADERYLGVIKLIEFITGSLLVVLVAVSFIDQKILVNFTIWDDHPVLFVMGVVGFIFVVCQSSVKNQGFVSDPEKRFNELKSTLHFEPYSWDRLSLKAKHREIRKLFRYKVVVFLHEILSILYGPFIFLFWLPKRCDTIVKFLRDHSVEVHGRGVMCTWSLLNRGDEEDPPTPTPTNPFPSETSVSDNNSNSQDAMDMSLNLKYNTSVANFQRYYRQAHQLPTLNDTTHTTF